MDGQEEIDFFGVRIAPVRKSELVEILTSWAGESRQRLVGHVNVHAMNLASTNPRFLTALRSADLVFCDGHGVKWGAKRLGHALPERLAVMDWLDDFAASIAERGHSLFLLGDEEGVAQCCADTLQRQYPGLLIAGTHHGFFEKSGPESTEVVEKINASGADVLMVGFGMPTQEFWLEDHMQDLDVRVMVPVGAAFRWYAGIERRAPRWLIERGLEWLWRLARHPVKMFGRYVIGNPVFAWRVLAEQRRQSRKP